MTGMPRWSASAASAEVFGLGEGPLWDAPRRRVLWVDINAGTVHEGRLDGTLVARSRSHRLDRTVGAVACSDAGDLLIAGAHALTTVLTTGEHRPGPVILASPSRRRLNDGTCDPAGAFLLHLMRVGEAGSEKPRGPR
jgi:sugar lactone lactonase YvrE